MQYFEDLYKSDAGARPNLDGLSFPSMSSDKQTWLEREFEEEELYRALNECDGDKAFALLHSCVSSTRGQN